MTLTIYTNLKSNDYIHAHRNYSYRALLEHILEYLLDILWEIVLYLKLLFNNTTLW